MMGLTGGSRVCRTRLDSGSLPTLDGVQNAFLLFSFGSKSSDFLAGYNGAAGRLVYDAGEDGTSVAAVHAVSIASHLVAVNLSLHCRNDGAIGVHIRRNRLKALGVRIVYQGSVASGGKKDTVLSIKSSASSIAK